MIPKSRPLRLFSLLLLQILALPLILMATVYSASAPTVVSFDSFGQGSVSRMSDGSTWSWGNGNPVPKQTQEIPGVKYAFPWGSSIVALRDDGTVWAMNANGSSPVPLPMLNNVKQISGHSLLKNDGTVWIWSTGSADLNSAPMQVPGLSSVESINDGAGLKSDGTLWEWSMVRSPSSSSHSYSFTDLTPVQVPISSVKAFSDGPDFGIALLSDGSVMAWGRNDHGQLGNSSAGLQGSLAPVRVTGLDDIKAISRGSAHALALKNDGTLWGWGSDQYLQLGASSAGTFNTPVQATSMFNIDKFAALGDTSVVSKADGSVWALGRNDQGQLGTGSTSTSGSDKPLRVLVNPDVSSTITAISSPTADPSLSPHTAPSSSSQPASAQNQSSSMTPISPGANTSAASPVPSSAVSPNSTARIGSGTSSTAPSTSPSGLIPRLLSSSLGAGLCIAGVLGVLLIVIGLLMYGRYRKNGR